MSKQIENLDLDTLLAEVSKEVDQLVKSQQIEVAALKKAEESSKEESKEESSKEESKEKSSMEKSGLPPKAAALKKDDAQAEDSGYESQAPEATMPQDDSQSQPPQDDGQGDNIEAMISGLDDEMLHEIYQKIKMELQGRMSQGQEQQPEEPPMEGPAPQGAPVDAPAPMDMGKSDKSQEGEKLSKAESDLAKTQKELDELKKTTGMLAEIVEKVISRPVVRAVTDIRSVGYVDKGESALKKAELENMSDEDIKKKLTAITSDRSKMATLTKKENEAILDFFANKKRTNEILEIIK